MKDPFVNISVHEGYVFRGSTCIGYDLDGLPCTRNTEQFKIDGTTSNSKRIKIICTPLDYPKINIVLGYCHPVLFQRFLLKSKEDFDLDKKIASIKDINARRVVSAFLSVERTPQHQRVVFNREIKNLPKNIVQIMEEFIPK